MKLSTTPLRAATYGRVSSGKQVEGTSLESQDEAMERKAVAIGATVAADARFSDPGVSGGYLLARPGMQAALAYIEAGHADVLIMAKLDRMSRDREHQSAIKKRVEAAGARLVFCDMDFSDTPEGDLAFGIMGSFAEYERKVIRDRTTKGRRKRAEQGTQPCRSWSPRGYRVVTKEDVLSGAYPPGTQGTYQIVESEAGTVREIFTRYAAGQSLNEVAKWLHANHVPTARGGVLWQPTTIRVILTNPAYKGQPAFGRLSRVVDEARVQDGRKAAYYKRTTEEAWIELQAPPIVDAATWDACQVRLRQNQELRGGRPTADKSLLTGLIRCPRCGKSMKARKSPRVLQDGSTKKYVYYHCPNYNRACNAAGEVCTPGEHSGEVLDRLAVTALLSWVDRPELMDSAVAAYARRHSAPDSSGEAERLQRELKALAARERATVDAQIAGIAAGADATVYARLLGDIAGQRNTLQARLDRLAPVAAADPRPRLKSMAGVFRDLVGQAREVLTAPEVPTATKREILMRAIEQAKPEGDGLRVWPRPLHDMAPNTAGTDANTLHSISMLCKVSILSTPSGVRIDIEDGDAAEERAA